MCPGESCELTEHDALGAPLEAELQIDPDDLANPVEAAAASALSFTLGVLLPLVAVLLPPESLRVPVTVVAVLVALALAGTVSARLGGTTPHTRACRGPGRPGWPGRPRPHVRHRSTVRHRHQLTVGDRPSAKSTLDHPTATPPPPLDGFLQGLLRVPLAGRE